VLLHQLLVSWGPQGFDAFLKRLQRKYGQQALAAAAAAEQHLAGVAEWQPVTAGMFLWVKLKGAHAAVCVRLHQLCQLGPSP
jgi:DNA-binding transcriptional MocR family regulator